MSRGQLLKQGSEVLNRFCAVNTLPVPAVKQYDDAAKWPWSACAFYRPVRIAICVPKCAQVGLAGRSWSFPGYVVDRTPYGVLQHELGHHVDFHRGTQRGPYWSDFSKAVMESSGEEAITSYCPNFAEWFAEMFRVFVTNPDLLRLVRPRTYRELRQCFEPVFTDSWRERLKGAPARTIQAAQRHIERAAA